MPAPPLHCIGMPAPLLLLLAVLAPAARALFECGDSAAGPFSRTIAGRALDYRSGTNASYADFGLPMQLAFCPWTSGAGGGGASLLVVDAAAAVIRRVNLAPAPLAEPGLGSLFRQGTVDIFAGAPNIRGPSTVFADYFPYTDRFLSFVNVSGIACDATQELSLHRAGSAPSDDDAHAIVSDADVAHFRRLLEDGSEEDYEIIEKIVVCLTLRIYHLITMSMWHWRS